MAIVIRESNDVNTSIKHLKGFIFETILAPNYFLNDLNEIELFNSNILLIDNYLDDINDISNVLNKIILDNSSLIILANDYNEL